MHEAPPIWGFIIVLLTCKEAEPTVRSRNMPGLRGRVLVGYLIGCGRIKE